MNDTAESVSESKPAQPWGIAAAVGFAALAVLLVALAITEENIVGSLAGVTGIASGICLGIWLVRTEPPSDATEEDPAS